VRSRNFRRHHLKRETRCSGKVIICKAHLVKFKNRFHFCSRNNNNNNWLVWPVRGPFLTLPLAPRGEICLLGEMFTPSFTPRGEHSLLFRRMEGRSENFTPRGFLQPYIGHKVHSWGTTSPLWVKVCP
jgi:hypothetical protein